MFLGQGPARLEDGTINPLAVGVLLTGATVGLIKDGTNYAVYATGTLQIIGVAGITVVGTATVRFNNTGKVWNRTFTIEGSDRDVVVRFDDDGLDGSATHDRQHGRVHGDRPRDLGVRPDVAGQLRLLAADARHDPGCRQRSAWLSAVVLSASPTATVRC